MAKRILAIASGGGHWQQLMLLRPAFAGNHVAYVTTVEGLPEEFNAKPAAIVPDCNRNAKGAAIRSAMAIAAHVFRHRPDIVISTGALPGVIALALGRTIGARTIWIDSIANAEEMSRSGQLAKRFADHWLTQWRHVAEETGAVYAGAVL